ncbi:hypothetical protein E8E14_012958 [Neopestalotiopsis sp. 37M]|nr:hypothetical protein E8E14_012958 [Neopestalotiopsis sp. 37M]
MANNATWIREQLDHAANNITALQKDAVYGWIPSQNYRCTADILWSCILTLTACVYTVLHLNVANLPSKKAGIIERLKLKWVATALFAPELMLYLALTQFLEARWLKLKLQELQRQSKTSRKDFVFDMRYAFFVVMGGLQISYEDIATDWGIFRGAPEEKPPPPRPIWNPWTEYGQRKDSQLHDDWYERVQEWQEHHDSEWNARPYDEMRSTT